MAAARLPQRLRRFIWNRGSRWARRRQGTDTLPTQLAARRIYIVPTRAGACLAALLLAMLAAGLNYNNSLTLLLTFTLTGYALVGMHQCHRRLLGLRVEAIDASACCVGESLQLELLLRQPQAADPAQLQALLLEDGRALASATGTSVDSDSDSSVRITLRWPAMRRGPRRLDALSLRTRAPAGLFRAGVWLHVDVTTLVYPRAAGDRPLPQAPGEQAGERHADGGLDELNTLRAFRHGDSPRQVAWKAYARGAPLLVKEYHGLGGQEHEFDYARLAGLEPEARLSQLCQWTLAAERRGESYALRLPGQYLPADTGPRHLGDCLAALALFGLPADAHR